MLSNAIFYMKEKYVCPSLLIYTHFHDFPTPTHCCVVFFADLHFLLTNMVNCNVQHKSMLMAIYEFLCMIIHLNRYLTHKYGYGQLNKNTLIQKQKKILKKF